MASIWRRHRSARIFSQNAKSAQRKVRFSKYKNTPWKRLSEVNKYVFVQDFDKASLLLENLSYGFDEDFEIQFRRVEVDAQCGKLNKLIQELNGRIQEAAGTDSTKPPSLALQMAHLLGTIKSSEQQEQVRLPQLAFQGGQGGSVYALGAGIDEGIGSVKPLWHISGGDSFAKKTSIPHNAFRVHRFPNIPDDHHVSPNWVAEGPEAVADEVALGIEKHSPTVQALNEEPGNQPNTVFLNKAMAFLKDHPHCYAAWFTAACAYEHADKLQEAIDSWERAYRLNPKSLCTLATLAELQHMGTLSADCPDYISEYERLDRFLVHGSMETHKMLFSYFFKRKETKQAIASLRTLADWIQNQRGDVPAEIEVTCLLGAMQAYREEGNTAASEACLKEAENIANVLKKTQSSFLQLAFVAQRFEEFGLAALAKMCFYAVISNPQSPKDLVVQTAAHCLSNYPSKSLKDVLKVAYKNTLGDNEVRFCYLICVLALDKVPVRDYMEIKTELRQVLKEGQFELAATLCQSLLNKTNEDAEVHYYMGELLSKQNAQDKARFHFQSMFDLDPYNEDSLLRFVNFLLKSKDFNILKTICEENLNRPHLSSTARAEVSWLLATSYYVEKNYLKSKHILETSLVLEPWNVAFLTLMLKLMETQIPSPLPVPNLVESIYDLSLSQGVSATVSPSLMSGWQIRVRAALETGYNEYAYTLARLMFLFNKTETVLDVFCRASAGYNPRIAAQQLLMMRESIETPYPFAEMAAVIARIYSHAGDWPLVDEWLDIANRGGIQDKHTRSKLFEIEALRLTMGGSNFRRAQNLLEAAIDSYDGGQKVPTDTSILHGYLMVAQGDVKAGVEKMQHHIEESPSIQGLYFLVKGYERAGRLGIQEREHITKLFRMSPTNRLEQKLIEEIHCAVGLQNNGVSASLMC